MNSSISELKMVWHQSIISRKLLFCLGAISIVASIGCVAADLIMQYDPQGRYSRMAPVPLTTASWRVLTGGFLGTFCIPLEIAGYWLVFAVLRATLPRLAQVLFWVMAYGIVLGTVFHAAIVPLFFVEQAARNATGAAQISLLQVQNTIFTFILPLAAFFEICYFVVWSIIVVAILRTSTHYPKWLVFFVPALGSLIIAVIGQSHILPVLGNILYPTVSSLPHLLFFLLFALVMWRRL